MQAGSYCITEQGTGVQFPCRGDEFVLAAMLRARCGPVRHGCCGGGCGVCKARVVRGRYRQEKPMSRAHVDEREGQDGFVLLCCIKPCSDITILREERQTKKEDLPWALKER